VVYHIRGGEGDGGEPQVVPDLGRLLGALISSRVSGEDLVILCGGPGSGKSTLCRVMASELAQDPLIHPVFLRLRRVKEGAEISQFIDPANPGQIIEWKGNWRQLVNSYKWDPQWKNFAEVWTYLDFGRLLFNTIAIAALGTLGTVLSCTAVAYGFARFRLPAKGLLFTLLIGTIILPSEVTLIPTYIVFYKIGWVGTWLPLIVPHFFANAWNVFLMRQFIMGIPREIDEAAMIDGANPLQTLLYVIIPQAAPAMVAISLFHFFWAWNDFFQPLIYLAGKPALYTISVAMQTFQVQYGGRPELTMTASLMATVIPFILFFLGQRFFMQGIVVTGVEK